MQRTTWGIAALVCLLVTCALMNPVRGKNASAQVAPQRSGGLSVHYAHAGLTEVDVEGASVQYVWHTLKERPMAHQQSLHAYDRHSARKQLTAAQQDWLTAWVRKHRVFDFKTKYASGDPRSYGAAFISRLQVRQGGRTRTVDWDDTSRASGPNAAAEELIEWAAQVTGAR